jgi:hypothetical protein
LAITVASHEVPAGAARGQPDGLSCAAAELDFLHPLPVVRLWGVGPITADKLRARGIHTVGEVALLGEPVLVALLGRASGRHLHALAHNRDPRPVQVGRRRGSIGSQRALGRGYKTRDEIDATGGRRPVRGCAALIDAAPWSACASAFARPVPHLRATASTPVILAAGCHGGRSAGIADRRAGNLDDDDVVQLAAAVRPRRYRPARRRASTISRRFSSAMVTSPVGRTWTRADAARRGGSRGPILRVGGGRPVAGRQTRRRCRSRRS